MDLPDDGPLGQAMWIDARFWDAEDNSTATKEIEGYGAGMDGRTVLALKLMKRRVTVGWMEMNRRITVGWMEMKRTVMVLRWKFLVGGMILLGWIPHTTYTSTRLLLNISCLN